MAKEGRLIYEDINGGRTEIVFFQYPVVGTPTFVDFCGTADPLTISWKGDRYGVTFASSATIRLLVETIEQRQLLESIFNGGWHCIIRKGTPTPGVFWHGKITPTLGIGSYSTYPYELHLNANDGVADAKKVKLLNTDYPEPFNSTTGGGLPARVSVLDMLLKIITTTFVPDSGFDLYVANILFTGAANTRVLENTFLDPLVFMDADDNNYIASSEILKSLLGPLNLRLFQWKGDWYVMSLDAAWDGGSITFEKYTVAAGVGTYDSVATQTNGILDLYSCVFTSDYEVNNATQIEFIAPWFRAEVMQQFQMNYNIFPAFANRSGNFYSGDTATRLEFSPAPVTERLRHWTHDGLVTLPFQSDDNEGSVLIPVVHTNFQALNSDFTSVTVTVDPTLTFDKFFFSCNTASAFNGEPRTGNGVGIKKVFKIEYTNGGTWHFWRNNAGDVNDKDAFDGWTTGADNYVFDHDDVDYKGGMPDRASYTGGTFKFSIRVGYDDNFIGPNWGYYLSNFKFGIITTQFENIKFSARVNEWGSGNLAQRASALLQNKGYTDRKAIQDEVTWDHTIDTLINTKGSGIEKFEYRWGLYYPNLKSHHELHLSAPYDSTDSPVELFFSKDEAPPVSNELTDRKLALLQRDNATYTTKLMGQWVSNKISPFQVVHDLEGRVYNFAGGNWNDRQGNWSCDFIEFKGLQGPVFSGTLHQLTVGTDGTRYGLSGPDGSITPTAFDGDVITALYTTDIHQNEAVFSVGAPIAGLNQVKVHFIYPGDNITLTLAGNNYIGDPSSVHAYMKSEVGNVINVFVEKLI